MGWIWSASTPWLPSDEVEVRAYGRATGPNGQDVGHLRTGGTTVDTVPGRPTTSTGRVPRGAFEPMGGGSLSTAVT